MGDEPVYPQGHLMTQDWANAAIKIDRFNLPHFHKPWTLTDIDHTTESILNVHNITQITKHRNEYS
ncbi:hypothetical protein HBI17_228850 [Parastagonospora nodorum]|nr:hypothetical protein HBI17_228850 [Parastagonospora nodorum]